jgi:23S rRNA pseudouridine1911/1915/1917 synthase
LKELDYVLELNNYFALEINLHNGRPSNQMQLFCDSFPIKGDLKYGFDRSNLTEASENYIFENLFFAHPVTKDTISITGAK